MLTIQEAIDPPGWERRVQVWSESLCRTGWSAPMVHPGKPGGCTGALSVWRTRKGGCQAQQSPVATEGLFQKEKPKKSGKAGQVNATTVGKTLRRRRASEPPSYSPPADEGTMYICQTSGLQLQRLLGGPLHVLDISLIQKYSYSYSYSYSCSSSSALSGTGSRGQQTQQRRLDVPLPDTSFNSTGGSPRRSQASRET
ncbi:hypothetical protein CRENBAI_000793 [Crenichthys baileyi]|uniref:Uncharacterized protein n=1 Tax=Crenichthys baileyi TaxID=28760 RepID=A0AAV9R5X2_9TELE